MCVCVCICLLCVAVASDASDELNDLFEVSSDNVEDSVVGDQFDIELAAEHSVSKIFFSAFQTTHTAIVCILPRLRRK